jgi:carbonic anhydrase
VRGDAAFADVLAANERYAAGYRYAELTGKAGRGLAVLTCIDSRIEPLAMLGLAPGDAKILRNPGARVDDDVLATLVLCRWLLGVERVMVVAHTDCRMSAGEPAELHDAIRQAGGPDTRDLAFAVAPSPGESARADVARIRDYERLAGVKAGAFVYDVATGVVERVD